MLDYRETKQFVTALGSCQNLNICGEPHLSLQAVVAMLDCHLVEGVTVKMEGKNIRVQQSEPVIPSKKQEA